MASADVRSDPDARSIRARPSSPPMPTRCARWSPTCARACAEVGQGGGEAARATPSRARQAAAARARRGADRSRLAVSRTVAARRLRPVRRRGAGRRHRHRHRPRGRARMRDRRQRRDGEGRHLFSDDREEASARAGDRAAEPPALHLSGRFRRRLPADAGRGLPRSRAFRPHLLQPGQPVGAGHSADRRGHGLVHRGRRLCAGDERRDASSCASRARSFSAARRW